MLLRVLLVATLSLASVCQVALGAKWTDLQLQELLRTDDPVGQQSRLPQGRILLMSAPYAAHALPLLRLGHELAQRGHSITFTSTDDYVNMTFGKLDWEGLGVRFEGAGPPSRNETERKKLEQFAYEHYKTDPGKAFKLGSRIIVRELFYDLCNQLLRRYKPGDWDLVITEGFAFCGFDLAEHLEVPCVWVGNTHILPMVTELTRVPWISTEVALPPAVNLPLKLNVFQAAQNIAMVVLGKYLLGYLILSALEEGRAQTSLLSSSAVAAAARRPPPLVLVPAAPGIELPLSLPPYIHVVGNMFFDPAYFASGPGSMAPDLTAWLDEAAADGQPVLYVTFGTVVSLKDAQYNATLQALAALPAALPRGVRVLYIVRIGKPFFDAAAAARQVPAHVRIENWVPQLKVLKHPAVKAVLSHGGFSTYSEALYYGLPQVAMPVFADNDVNAAHIERHGAGMQVDKESPRLRAQLEAALVQVLSNATYAANARRLGMMLRTAPGPSHAAALVENVMALGTTSHLQPPDNLVAMLGGAALLLMAVLLVLALAVLAIIVTIRTLLRLIGFGVRRVSSDDAKAPSKGQKAD